MKFDLKVSDQAIEAHELVREGVAGEGIASLWIDRLFDWPPAEEPSAVGLSVKELLVADCR